MGNLNQLMQQLSPERRAKVELMASEMILDYQLQQIRQTLELSQQELAEKMGISQPTLSAIENRGQDVKLSTLKRYIEAAGGKLRLDIELPTGQSVGFRL